MKARHLKSCRMKNQPAGACSECARRRAVSADIKARVRAQGLRK